MPLYVCIFRWEFATVVYLTFDHICFEKLILTEGELQCSMAFYVLQVRLCLTPVWLLFITYICDKGSLSFDSGKASVLGVMRVFDPFLPSPTLPLFCAPIVSYEFKDGPEVSLQLVSSGTWAIRLAIHLYIFLANSWSHLIIVFSWVVFFCCWSLCLNMGSYFSPWIIMST